MRGQEIVLLAFFVPFVATKVRISNTTIRYRVHTSALDPSVALVFACEFLATPTFSLVIARITGI